MLKRCFKCLQDKPVEEFYRHRMMADGRLNKCKECAKFDVAVNRLKSVERVRQYDRDRATQSHRVALRERVIQREREEHPQRAAARLITTRAVRSRKLVKPQACEGCSRTDGRLEAHHLDYSRPLLVMFLCKPCHAIADKIRWLLENVEKAS